MKELPNTFELYKNLRGMDLLFRDLENNILYYTDAYDNTLGVIIYYYRDNDIIYSTTVSRSGNMLFISKFVKNSEVNYTTLTPGESLNIQDKYFSEIKMLGYL